MEPGFLDNLAGSSLDRVELATALEEACDAEIPLEDLGKIRKFRTIQEVLEYLRKGKKGGD